MTRTTYPQRATHLSQLSRAAVAAVALTAGGCGLAEYEERMAAERERIWALDADLDSWAWCRLDADVKPVTGEGEPNLFFDVEQTFSTEPGEKCSDQQINDPLQEPQDLDVLPRPRAAELGLQPAAQDAEADGQLQPSSGAAKSSAPGLRSSNAR